MANNFPKLMSDTKPQIQKAQRAPGKINVKGTMPRPVTFKLQKIKGKEKKLKEGRGKDILPIEGQR